MIVIPNHYERNFWEEPLVYRLSNTGELIVSTYLGGNNTDSVSQLLLDSNNNIYLCGNTESFDFPVLNNFQIAENDSSNGFLAKFVADFSLEYSTLIGGSKADDMNLMKIDSQDNVYLSGSTSSEDFPAIHAYNNTKNGNYDIFLTIVGPNGTILLSTYIGGNKYEESFSLFIDTDDNIYIGGATTSVDFFTKLSPSMGSNLKVNGIIIKIRYLPKSKSDSSPFLDIFSLIQIILATIFTISAILGSYKIYRLVKQIQSPSIARFFQVWRSPFDSYSDYQLARYKGASTKDELNLVLQFKAPNITTALKIDEGGFKDYEEYLKRISVGASSKIEYALVDLYKAPDVSKNWRISVL